MSDYDYYKDPNTGMHIWNNPISKGIADANAVMQQYIENQRLGRIFMGAASAPESSVAAADTEAPSPMQKRLLSAASSVREPARTSDLQGASVESLPGQYALMTMIMLGQTVPASNGSMTIEVGMGNDNFVVSADFVCGGAHVLWQNAKIALVSGIWRFTGMQSSNSAPAAAFDTHLIALHNGILEIGTPLSLYYAWRNCSGVQEPNWKHFAERV